MPHQPELIPTEPSPEQTARNAEREKYLALLAEKLKDPDFRAIEGFPIAEDEAILALSDPPYYTACPNPFLPEIIEKWQQERGEQTADERPPTAEQSPNLPLTITTANPSPPTCPKAKTTPSTTPTPTTPKCPTKPLCATSSTTPSRATLFLTASAAPA